MSGVSSALCGRFLLAVLPLALAISCETPGRVSRDIAVSLPHVSQNESPAILSQGGPAVLPTMEDAVVARLGEWALRKSDVYDHLMEQDPDQVRAALAVMLSQRVVAKRCDDEGILIDDEELRSWFVGHFDQLKRRVTLDYGKSVGVERYLRVTYGQSVDQYQRIAVDRERDFRLMAHVVRFAQLTEDRVRLRLLSVPDRIEAKRLRRKLTEGADFERLARQASSHSSREKGGQLDPMWTASLNVALKEAVAGLDTGKISGVVDSRDELGRRQFFIIQLLERIPGRAETYAQLKDEIEKGLAKSPLATSEFVMWQARINNQVELVPAVR